jgi:sugar lactone lactonase YvrE
VVLAAACSVLALSGLSGCGDDSGNPGGHGGSSGTGGTSGTSGTGGTGGGGAPMSAAVVSSAGVFAQPLDAVPNRDGSLIYFSAFDQSGAAQIYQIAAGGGAPTMLTQAGSPLEVPTGLAVAPDDSALYIVDLAAARANSAIGGLYRLPLPQGGVASPLSGADAAIYPISIAVSPDGQTLYFSGATAADDHPALFSIPASGGSATAITAGGQLRDPSGIAIAANGTVYIVDATAGGEDSATVFRVAASGEPSALAQGLRVGFPAGLALTGDGQTLLVAGAARGATAGTLLGVPIAGGDATPIDFSSAGVTSPAGLHRAAASNQFALADDLAANPGSEQTGAIFKLQ